jgi:hypothetical protein
MKELYLVSMKGYARLWNRIKGNSRIEIDKLGIDPYMTREEKNAVFNQVCNPSMPNQIVMHTHRGSFCVIPRKGK